MHFRKVGEEKPPVFQKADEGLFYKRQAEKWETLTLQLETITPVLGGGADAGQPDLLWPFRPRAIRNGIKHWWWLLYRHQYHDQKLPIFEDMAAIWGAASTHDQDSSAKARIRVSITDPGRVVPYDEDYRNYGRYMYALFGAKSANGSPPSKLVLPGAKFLVKVQISRQLKEQQREQVLKAIQWWLCFGGVGARTSRGLGKLKLINRNERNVSAVGRAITNDIPKGHDIQPFDGDGNTEEDKILDLLGKYKDFRQSREGHRGRGQSHWPKADIVRDRTGFNDKAVHTPRWLLAEIGDTRNRTPVEFRCILPEVLFGAPVEVGIGTGGTRQSAFLDFMTEERPLERFSSPLIFGFVPDPDGKLRPAALVLRIGTDFVKLKPAVRIRWKENGGDKTTCLPYGSWWPNWGGGEQYKEDAKALTAQIKPCAKYGGMTPLDAFRKFLEFMNKQKQK